MSASSPHEQRICGLFQKTRLLSETSETKIWEVADDAGRKYEAKMTKRSVNWGQSVSFATEYKVFSVMTNGILQYGRISNGITPSGFPNVFFAGKHSNDYDVIVTEFLFPDIFSFRNERRWNDTLTMSEYLMLAKHMLLAVQKLHWRGFVHQNVNPHNFKISEDIVPCLVNFSYAKRYIQPWNGRHCSQGQVFSMVGTPKYASLNAHRLKTLSRQDDLVSLGYTFIDMMKKGLPWDNDSAEQQGPIYRNTYIQTMKETLPLIALCNGLPGGIYQYMLAVTNLSFKEKPDYAYLTEMLQP